MLTRAQAARELLHPPLGQGMTPERIRQAFSSIAPVPRKNGPRTAPYGFSIAALRSYLRQNGTPPALGKSQAAAVAAIDSGTYEDIARAAGLTVSAVRSALLRVWRRTQC